MSSLGKTVADLVARARATAPEQRVWPLQEQVGFGDNPGDLRMWVYAPDGLAPLPPLVVVLHGCGQSAASYVEDSGWLALADRYGFVILCPEQQRSNNPNLCFNWFNPQDTRRGGGEAASIAAMIRKAKISHRIDPARVFVTGLSAGGAMAVAMLATYPELFAAGSIVAGLPYGAAGSLPEALSAMKSVPKLSARSWGDKLRQASPAVTRWPKVAIWHGDADTTVAPGAADALVAQWSDIHDVADGQAGEPLAARHRVKRWTNALGEAVVEAHRIAGLGHGAPIAATGEDGCGAAAPWVLEAGVSSSLEMARTWGVADVRRAVAGSDRPGSQRYPEAPTWGVPHGQPIDVNAVISKALRGAGLLT